MVPKAAVVIRVALVIAAGTTTVTAAVTAVDLAAPTEATAVTEVAVLETLVTAVTTADLMEAVLVTVGVTVGAMTTIITAAGDMVDTIKQSLILSLISSVLIE